MKAFKKLRHYLKHLPKRVVFMIAGLGLLAAVPVAMTVAEFYPDRPTFDYNKPCNPDDNDPYDRCGSLSGPVFNSFVNTPSYGDERAFLDARRSDQTAAGSYENVLTNVTEGSKEVVIRMYVHNNANQGTNADGTGVARNTRVRVLLPTGTNDALRARGYINADNATPRVVEDTVDLVGSKEFSLDYVEGSAILYDNDNFKNGVKLSDSIVTSNGAPIGTDALDGKVKGCFEFEAVVQLRVKVIPKEIPEVDFDKVVGIAGKSGWSEEVTVKPGEKIKWLIGFKNTGEATLTNVRVSDKLPPHVSLVPGTVRYIDANQDVVQKDSPLFTTGGINFNDWKPNGGFYVRFETVAKGDFDGCEATIRNVAYNFTGQTDRIQDHADVKIVKEPCEEPKKPVYSCDMLTKTHLGDRKYRFNVDFTAENGATLKHYVFDFGDGSDKLVTTRNPVEHTYGRDGTFVARVTLAIDVNGEVKEVTSDECAVVIKITTPPEKPEKPKELPVTGFGSIAGIFAATSTAGTAAHYLIYRRRR